MTLRLSGHFSVFGLVSFVLKSPVLGIARQWSREKFTILTPKPRSHVRIVGYSPVIHLTPSALPHLEKDPPQNQEKRLQMGGQIFAGPVLSSSPLIV